MAEIRWTEEAERWLRDIHGYIAADNPTAAAKVVTGIFGKAQVLAASRKLGTSIVQRMRVESEFCSMDITALHTC